MTHLFPSPIVSPDRNCLPAGFPTAALPRTPSFPGCSRQPSLPSVKRFLHHTRGHSGCTQLLPLWVQSQGALPCSGGCGRCGHQGNWDRSSVGVVTCPWGHPQEPSGRRGGLLVPTAHSLSRSCPSEMREAGSHPDLPYQLSSPSSPPGWPGLQSREHVPPTLSTLGRARHDCLPPAPPASPEPVSTLFAGLVSRPRYCVSGSALKNT